MNAENYLDYEELASDIMDKVDELDEFESVYIFGYYGEIRTLLKELMMYDTVPFYIDLKYEEYSEYYDEYSIAIDENKNIYVQPVMVDGKYLTYESVCVFIFDYCCSSILKKNEWKDPEVYMLQMDDEEEIEYECEECNDRFECPLFSERVVSTGNKDLDNLITYFLKL